MIKASYLNIYVPEIVGEICQPEGLGTISSTASKLIGQKLRGIPSRYEIESIDLDPSTRSLKLQLALGAVVHAKLSELAIVANTSIAEAFTALILGCIKWREISVRSTDLASAEDVALQVGCMKRKNIGNHSYWYWRYYTRAGSRADMYLHKDRGAALARAKSIGIPEDANPKHCRR